MKHPFAPRWLLLALALCAIGSVVAAESSTPEGGSFTFKKGVNISHWLSQNFDTPYAAPWFGEPDVAWIAAHGFDHVRLAVDVRECLKPDGSLDPAKLKPIEDCIGWSRAHGLGLVLDAHFLPGADFNTSDAGGDKRVYTDPALERKVADLWRALARHFASAGPNVRFEILNEPVADRNEQLNPFMAHMLAAIRESNPTRVVYVTSNKWSQFSTVPDVTLPDDPHIALTIHNYEPLIFTHQRAPWVGFTDKLPAVSFPGTVPDWRPYLRPDYKNHTFPAPGTKLTVAEVDKAFQQVAAWVARHRPGLEVYVGEFGAYEAADDQSRIRWLHTIVHNCEERGWGWAVWEYEGSFGVRKPHDGGTVVMTGLGLKR